MLQLREEKMQLYEQYADERFSKELYMKKKDEISKKIDGLADRIEMLRAAVEVVTTLTSAEIEEYAEKYDNVEKEHRLSREMVEAFNDTVYIYSKDRIESVFNGENEITKTAQRSIHANPNGKM